MENSESSPQSPVKEKETGKHCHIPSFFFFLNNEGWIADQLVLGSSNSHSEAVREAVIMLTRSHCLA